MFKYFTGTIVAFMLLVIGISFFNTGCGHSVVGGELIGQVKKVQPHTPMLCDNYYAADMSLGIFQNGIGSASAQDVWLTIPENLVPQFNTAVESGTPVKVHYDEWRVTLCTEDKWVTSITPITAPTNK